MTQTYCTKRKNRRVLRIVITHMESCTDTNLLMYHKIDSYDSANYLLTLPNFTLQSLPVLYT